MVESCTIAVIGATGAVGRVFLNILEERGFPADGIRLCASERSLGSQIKVRDEQLVVEMPTPKLFSEVQIAFMSANSEVSRTLAPIAVDQGVLVIDDSSAFRMNPDVPLVVPEVNSDDLEGHRGIISIPNCSTTPLVMALKPLHDASPVRRVIVDTYQSVSGTGAAAVRELRMQAAAILDNRSVIPKEYPHQIAFNALPQIEDFESSGYTTEEMKIINETRKIMHEPDLQISATCVRVPVAVGHCEAIHVELSHPISPVEIREILSNSPGVVVLDEPKSNVYPMPIDVEGKDQVFVGRIRQDLSHPNSIAMWIGCDNLRKGSGLNAIQIAEEAMSRDLVGTARRRASHE